MNPYLPTSIVAENAEISTLIEVLRVTERRLEALLGDEVDSVTDRDGKSMVLRRAQGPLLESDNASQAAILNALPAHIAVLNSRGTIISVNNAWRQFADANTHQASGPGHSLGLNYITVCDLALGDHSFEAKRVAAGIRSVLGGESQSFAIEYPCHSPTEQRWFLLNVVPLAGGPSHGAVVTHTNITVRRQTAVALDQLTKSTGHRERMLSTMLASISDFAYIFDREGRFLFANQPMLNMFGLKLEQVVGRDCLELGFLPEVAAEFQGRLQRVFETRKSLRFETPHITRPHPEGYFEYLYSPALAEDGSVEFVVGTTRDITDRKRAEKATAESEAEFRTLAEAMPQVVWMTRAEGGAGYFNRRWMEYTGFTLEESLGRQWKSAMHPDDLQRTQVSWEQSATDGIHAVECRMRRADGVYRWWLVRAAPLLDAAGKVVKWFGTGTDIDELKTAQLEVSRANQELRQQRSELRLLFDLLPAMIWFKDAHNVNLRVNQRVADFAGRPVEEIEGKPTVDISAGVADPFHAELMAVMRSGTPQLGTVETVHDGQGREHWVQADRVPYRDEDGKVIGIVVVAQDITERIRAERTLRLEHTVARLLAEADDSGTAMEAVIRAICESEDWDLGRFFRVDEADGVLRLDEFWNKEGVDVESFIEASRNFLLRRGQGLGGTAWETGDPLWSLDTTFDSRAKQLVHTPAQKMHGAFVFPAHSAGRTLGVLSFTSRESRVPDARLLQAARVIGGQVGEYLRRKQAEDALRELNADLEARVHARTAELDQARDEAERANRAKSSFLATMSHEIRTPMNGVLGMIEVLHQTSLKGYQVEMVDLIRDSAFSLLQIIEDILDFSKIEAGKLSIEQEPLRLDETFERVCSMLHPLAVKQGARITLFVDPALPRMVLGDETRLRQILVNLVGNAIKFSGGREQAGVVSVRLVLVERQARTVTVDLIVSDNGIGIGQAAQALLFKPFSQADASTTRRFGGSGRGLAICHTLAGLMGGAISMQSVVDQGSTFSVRLPFAIHDDVIRDDTTALVQGLRCRIIGSELPLADDLAAYLVHAKVIVERSPDLTAAASAPLSPGLCLWLILPDQTIPDMAGLRALSPERSDTDTRFIVLGWGSRRRPRIDAPDLLFVDANALFRETLLRVLALASGRLHEEIWSDDLGSVMPVQAQPRDVVQAPGRLILVAEDNETNRVVIRKQLALIGFAADIVVDGHEALERWRSGEFALLLTDVHMPRMDGYALARAIRSEEASGRHMPIIALTANALRNEELLCRDAGMDAYLSKPVRLAQLKTAIEAQLSPAIPPATVANPVTPAPSIPLVNLGVLTALVGDDSETIDEVLKAFRESVALSSVEFKQGLLPGSERQTADAAHKLKSAARAIGALSLGELCARIEEMAAARRMDELAVLLPLFHDQSDAVLRYLDTR